MQMTRSFFWEYEMTSPIDWTHTHTYTSYTPEEDSLSKAGGQAGDLTTQPWEGLVAYGYRESANFSQG